MVTVIPAVAFIFVRPSRLASPVNMYVPISKYFGRKNVTEYLIYLFISLCNTFLIVDTNLNNYVATFRFSHLDITYPVIDSTQQ